MSLSLTKLIAICFLVTTVFSSQDDMNAYKKVPYADMRKKLRRLAKTYGHIMKLEDSKSLFDIEYGPNITCPSSKESGYDEHCVIDIVTLGDQKVK